MRRLSALFFVIGLFIFFAPQAKAATLTGGDLIKASQPAVYYYGADGKRYVFPNEKTYKTWYSDFSTVKTITDAELAAISIGGNATYKAGVKMVKITTDPKVYAVAKNGVLRWIKTEAAAIVLYGTDWNKNVEDIPDAFFTNYTVGADINSAIDFDKAAEMAADIIGPVAAAPCSGCGSQAPPPVTYQWNIKTVNDDIYYHKGLEFGSLNAGFAAVWYDDRNGQNEIFYEKTDAAGVGDGTVNKVSNNITDSNSEKFAHNGSNFYILWEDSSPLYRAIYSQKYDLDGNIIKKSVFASSTFATSRYPDIAWNGALGEYGAVWWDTKSTMTGASGDLYFSAMLSDGSKFGPELKVTSAPSSGFKPRIISAGNKFAIIWQGDDKVIKMALIDNYSAVVGDIKNIATASQVTDARLAWNGLGFGAVWADTSGGNQDIYFAQLDSSGNSVGNKAVLTSGAGDAAEPDVLWDGVEFYAAYTNYKPNLLGAASDVRVMKIDTTGNITGEAQSISNSGATAFSPRLAKNGLIVGAAWIENGGAANKIFSAVETQK